jgi:6-phosphogluconate dehydrogenase (decarboxylating)
MAARSHRRRAAEESAHDRHRAAGCRFRRRPGTVDEAIALGVPAPVITLAPIQRLRSRDTQSFSDKLLAAMRNEFGGHPIVKE